jgi:hypothetical protein
MGDVLATMLAPGPEYLCVHSRCDEEASLVIILQGAAPECETKPVESGHSRRTLCESAIVRRLPNVEPQERLDVASHPSATPDPAVVSTGMRPHPCRCLLALLWGIVVLAFRP